MKTALRTHTCGALRATDVDAEVRLAGWAHAIRVYGKVNFIDLRDRYGITQIVLGESLSEEAKKIRPESVLHVTGVVKARGEGMVRKELTTGEIEVHASAIKVLSPSEQLPLDISGKIQSNEDTRLKYRYLDLRRHDIQNHFLIRHKAMKATMNFLDSKGFYYITTPMLVKSTPEGARDYVVPSRVSKGKFYALPQSPQIYKQILMTAGFDRYFQFATCLRDEDLRADRQPEHMQIDMEMSFVEKDDVFVVVEGLMKAIWQEALGVTINTPFKRIAHKDAINRYGSDKPDLRFGLELQDVSSVFKESEFSIFKNTVASGGVIKALVAPQAKEKFSKKELKKLEELAKVHHAKGLAIVEMADGLTGGPSKFWSDGEKQALVEQLQLKSGDLLFLVADKLTIAAESLGQVRLVLGKKLDLIKKDLWEFAWIVDFPLFEYDEDKKEWMAAHHPFCMPREEHIPFLEKKEFGKVYCEQYDLTLNGVELCSGSIRISNPDVQEKVFTAMGLTPEVAEAKFGFLLETMKYGAPPMGGVGLGFDRIIALLCGLTDIREIIAFPKNKHAVCPMDGCPSEVSEDQLHELGIFHYEE